MGLSVRQDAAMFVKMMKKATLNKLSSILGLALGFILLCTVGVYTRKIIIRETVVSFLGDGAKIARMITQTGMVGERAAAGAESFDSLERWMGASRLNGHIQDWCILVSDPDALDAAWPVVFSANLDPEVLPASWDGVKDGERKIPLTGSITEPWIQNHAVVVIRKGGGMQILNAGQLCLDTFFMKRPFSSEKGRTARYLTADGLKGLGGETARGRASPGCDGRQGAKMGIESPWDRR